MEKLRPCPFCGGENVSVFGPVGWYRTYGISHSCRSFYSGAQDMFQGFKSEKDAAIAWNTRDDSKTAIGLIDEICGDPEWDEETVSLLIDADWISRAHYVLWGEK